MSRRSSPPSSMRTHQGTAADDAAAAWAMQAAAMTTMDAMAYAGSYAGAFGLPADAQASTSSGANCGRELDESNVYVARLPSNFTLEKFNELMGRYGTVMSVRLLEGDRWQKKGVKGVGFARMSRPDEAAKAIQALNALRLPGCGENLQARYAYKKTKDQPSTVANSTYPESMPWFDPTAMAAMQWAAYGMAGYGAGQSGVYSHGAEANGASAAASAAAAAGQSDQAGDYAAWMAQMGYYYPYGEYYDSAAGGSAWDGAQANPAGSSGCDGGSDGASGSSSRRHAVGSEAAGSRRGNGHRSTPSPDRRDRKKLRRSDESRRGHRSRSTSADRPYRPAHGSSRRDRKPERADCKSSSMGKRSIRDSKEGASPFSKTGSPLASNNMASRKSTINTVFAAEPQSNEGTVQVKQEPEFDMSSMVEPKIEPLDEEGGVGYDAGPTAASVNNLG